MTADRATLERIAKATAELKKRRTFDRLSFYEPYGKQAEFHDAGATFRERLFMAGNRCGKTFCGAAETAMHLTGRYPDDWLGRRFTRPTEFWAASDTAVTTRDIMQNELCGPPGNEDMQGSGAIPRDAVNWKGGPSLARGVTDAYDTVPVKHISGGWSSLQFKSYDQGRRKFQGTAKDGIWMDEEPDMDVYSECLTRIAPRRRGDPSGMVYLTFTPLLGMSTVVNRFLLEPSPDRHVTTMGIEEALHISPEEREKIIAAYPDHEREARALGIPMLGSGRIFQHAESAIKCEPFEVPWWWPKLWAIDFGMNHPFAAVLLAWDRDNDVVYVIRCIRMKDALPILHAQAMLSSGKGIKVAWPQDGHQRGEFDGKLIPASKIYKAHGLNMMSHHATFPDGSNSTELGLLAMNERFASQRLKIFENMPEWFEEYRTYHRKDGQIVKERDDLMSATRVGIMALREARLRPQDAERLQQGTRSEIKLAGGVDRDMWGA